MGRRAQEVANVVHDVSSAGGSLYHAPQYEGEN
jgi:hypothetical protein